MLRTIQTEVLKPYNDDDIAEGSGIAQAVLEHNLEGWGEIVRA